MTAFGIISADIRLLLTGMLFLAAAAQMALCIYEAALHADLKRRILDAVLFTALLLACSWLSQVSRAQRPVPFPWIIVPLAAACTAVYTAAGIMRLRSVSRGTLSPGSVKQALDGMRSGILFADAEDRVILSNLVMGELSASLTGLWPQTLSGFTEALDRTERADAPQGDGGPLLYRFPDGRVWQFKQTSLDEPALSGYAQLVAQDMTELYETNRKLEEGNAELLESISKIRNMAKSLSERIPVEEALDLKIRIHNEIGSSLIELSSLADGGRSEDADAQLAVLDRALGLLEGRLPESDRSFSKACLKAKEMGAAIELIGTLPSDPSLESLISDAAGECVTNCIRHAGGKRVTVRTVRSDGIWTVSFTNDGRPPDSAVKEGGGLGSIRRSVEKAGGEMKITTEDGFKLVIRIPERRPEE